MGRRESRTKEERERGGDALIPISFLPRSLQSLSFSALPMEVWGPFLESPGNFSGP